MSYKIRLNSFRSHCLKMGVEILEDDLRFIDHRLGKHLKTDFKAILETYLQKWINGMGQDNENLSRQSQGRRNANLWLLDYG